MKKENNKKILFEIDGKPYFIENTEKKQVLNIKQGFHPLIKSLIKDQFVCHDLSMNDKTVSVFISKTKCCPYFNKST